MSEINTYDHLLLDDQVQRAICLAKVMHAGQVDKIGRPYFEHVAQVATYFEARVNDGEWEFSGEQFQEGLIAAYLHDIVEDTPMTMSDLVRFGFPAYSVSLINLLTRNHRIAKHLYYGAIKKDPIATLIKSADMDHNSDPLRLAGIEDDATRERLTQKYADGYRALGTTSRWS